MTSEHKQIIRVVMMLDDVETVQDEDSGIITAVDLLQDIVGFVPGVALARMVLATHDGIPYRKAANGTTFWAGIPLDDDEVRSFNVLLERGLLEVTGQDEDCKLIATIQGLEISRVVMGLDKEQG